MAATSPASSFATDSTASLDTLRHLHSQCVITLEAICSDPEYHSRQWSELLISLREWGACLAGTPSEPHSFESRLKNNAPLRDALRTHLQMLLSILKQTNGQEEADTPKPFKIAGIDVLSTAKHDDDGSVQYSAISKCISDLGAFQGSPSHFPSYEHLRPPTRRSVSSLDDGKEGSDLSSAASISPLTGPAQANKRVRKFSISSSAGGQTPVQQVSPSAEGLARQLQAMPGTTSRLSPTTATETTLPSLSQTLPSGAPPPSSAAPRMRSPYDASQYPPPQPQAPPANPYASHGLPPPPPQQQQMTFSQYPQPPHHNNYHPPPAGSTVPAEKRPPKRPPSMTGPSPSDQTAPRVVPQAPHRLLIPNQQGEDPGSAVTPSPKLTKTGRVSKALRGEPVHACNICDKVYTRAEHLRRHRSNHRVNLLRTGPANSSNP